MHPRDFEDTPHPSLAAPGDHGVSVRWLGVAGYEFAYEGTTLLIDPYLTRVGFWRFLAARLRSDHAAVDRAIGRADAVIVSHSHFDHAVDLPYIATKTGAMTYGSQSTANLMAAAGVPAERVVALAPGQVTRFRVGPFKVSALPSRHSTFGLGGKVPYPGDIAADRAPPLRARGFRCGEVFNFAIEVGGRVIYHLGSANLPDPDTQPESIAAQAGLAPVDLLLICIAARYATEDFTPRVLRALTPRVLMPMHYDNFFRGAERPMRLLPRTRFARFIEDSRAIDPPPVVRTLPLGGRLTLKVNP